MLILLWLLPAAIATGIAIVWAMRAERDAPLLRPRGEAAEARAAKRFADAISKPAVVAPHSPRPARERSTGVALRGPR